MKGDEEKARASRLRSLRDQALQPDPAFVDHPRVTWRTGVGRTSLVCGLPGRAMESELKRFYYDTAQVSQSVTLATLASSSLSAKSFTAPTIPIEWVLTIRRGSAPI